MFIFAFIVNFVIPSLLTVTSCRFAKKRALEKVRPQGPVCGSVRGARRVERFEEKVFLVTPL